MTRRAVIIAARRTPVAPRGGGLAHLQADELAALVVRQLIEDAGAESTAVDHVLLGNALYCGGNPARMAALRAGLPETVPALTVDTQCCSGLDAIILGARLIESGAAECVIAGGAESFSRAPLRMHRPAAPEDDPVPYFRPPFAPPPYADPDLAEAAAGLAQSYGVSREAQAEFAVASHEKARAASERISAGLVLCLASELRTDSFTRMLTRRTAMKAPVIAGTESTGLSAATIACEADGAAAVVIVSEDLARKTGAIGLCVTCAASGGGDPATPALTPINLAGCLLAEAGCTAADLTASEIHEAYAVQAMLTAKALSIPSTTLNRLGGGLARGHPIGASGAVLMVQLYCQLNDARHRVPADEFRGMALIPAAGGQAAGMLVTGRQG
jgi:acetyl-CoA C-acetyltransferase